MEDSILTLENLTVPRMFVSYSLTMVDRLELHIFSDASEKAIASVAYIYLSQGQESGSFICTWKSLTRSNSWTHYS